MCGISGIFAYQPQAPAVDLDEALRTREAMFARGPDDSGLWHDKERRIVLAHRRLTIIDTSKAGGQPMVDEANRIIIIFNGEIYNFRELRAEFEVAGYRFRSNCDTEVLLAAYAIHGPAMVRRLRGMFAFAIWDERKRELFLARDPFGIKPLFYSIHNGMFRFASQVKALCAGGSAGRGMSAAGQVGFFLWGHVPDPFTLYDDIKSLPAGSTLTVDERGVCGPRPYWSIAEALQGSGTVLNEAERGELLRETLKSSVAYHLMSDVPLGVFLSSGRDSGSILALANESAQGQLHTFTLGFDEYRQTADNEVPLAERLAGEFHTRHQTSWVKRDDFLADLSKILQAMDQPSCDGVNMYMVSREGRRSGIKVALTGIGGDEVFGGYPSFHQVPALMRAVGRIPLARAMGRGLRRLSAPMVKRLTSPKYAGLLEYGVSYSSAYLLRRALFMPWEIDEILGPAMTSEGLQELDVEQALFGSIDGLTSTHAMLLVLETSWYMRDRLLRDADWASMAHSLEIRVPFVDHVLLEALAPALASARPFTKIEMALTPHRRLPDEILDRPKTGFSVPVREWLLNSRVGSAPPERGLREWAKFVHANQTGQKTLAAVA